MPRHSGTTRRRRAAGAVTGLVMAVGAVGSWPSGASAQLPSAEVVVKVGPGVDIERVAAEEGLRIVRPLLASRGIYVVEPAPSADDAKDLIKDLIKDLTKREDVVYAEADEYEARVADDRFHAWPTGMAVPVVGGAATWADQPALGPLRLGDVHRVATGDGVLVAVLDTGADLDHAALAGHLSPGGFDYVADDADPSEETDGVDNDGDGLVDEAFGHGTHTAGLVALVAPEARILVYRVLDSDGQGDPHVVAEAVLDAVDAGADVINVSFGMGGKPRSKVLREAFKQAEKAGVVVVAAAGNDGVDGHRYPAESKAVIGVAALNDVGDDLADFSNYGKRALVAAPGQDVISALPGGGYGAWSGTSMAAPIVSGQVALVRSHHPGIKNKKVIELIARSSHKFRGARKIDKGYIDILASLNE